MRRHREKGLVPEWKIVAAKNLLAKGFALSAAASVVNMTARDLDIELWRTLGEGR